MDLSLSGQSRDAEGWRPAGSLGQEALFRIEQRNTVLASLPDRALVIAVGIVSGKGKLKAVLTVCSSMATSCVATQARQDGIDVAGKVPRTILPRLRVDQSRNLLTFEHGPDRDLASGERTEIAARLDRPESRRIDPPGRQPCQVLDRAVGGLPAQQQLHTGVVRRYRSSLGHSGAIRRLFLGETGSWAKVTSVPSGASCSRAPSASGGSSLRRRRRRSATQPPPGPET